MTAVADDRRELRALAVDRGDARLHAVVAGPERPRGTVVLGHGAGGSHLVFFAQVEALSRTHQVIAWDQRGFGASTGVATPHNAAEDVLALLDTVGVDRAHLLGQSMSGWAVVGAAQRAPERVRSLVLADTVAGMFTERTLAALDVFIASLAVGGTPVLGRSGALAGDFGRRQPDRAALYQLVGQLPGPGVAAVRAIRAVPTDEAALAALGIPTLFMVGEHDAIFASDEVVALAGRLGARCVVIPGAGHSPYFEAPELFGTEVSGFLAEVDAT